MSCLLLLLLLLSRFSRVRLCATPQTAAHQAPPSLGFPMDCSLLGSSVHGISQARVLEWVAIDSLYVLLRKAFSNIRILKYFIFLYITCNTYYIHAQYFYVLIILLRPLAKYVHLYFQGQIALFHHYVWCQLQIFNRCSLSD